MLSPPVAVAVLFRHNESKLAYIEGFTLIFFVQILALLEIEHIFASDFINTFLTVK